VGVQGDEPTTGELPILDIHPESFVSGVDDRPIGAYPPSPPWSERAKLLVAAMGFVLALIGLYVIRGAIPIAALAGLIAFLVAPLIRLAHRRLGLPSWLALTVAYVLVFLGTIGFSYLLVNSIVASISDLDPIGWVDNTREWLMEEADDEGRIVVLGLTFDMSGIIDSLGASVDDDGTGGLVIDAEAALQYLGTGLAGVRTIAGMLTAIVTTALVTALVAIYLNADSRRMHAGLIRTIPPGYERDGLMMMEAQKSVWRGYLYGQLVNSLITGFLVFVVLSAVGLPGAFLFGAVMVVLNMIPTFGPILAAIPGILAALLTGSTRWPDLESYWFALIITGIYIVVVQAQANVIAPRVMGIAVRLRPAVVLIGLIVGFQIGGLLGSLLVVPIIASIRDVLVYFWDKLNDRDPFPDVSPDTATSEA
jgi:predicted PurR-regulated permease PerM